MSAFIGQLITRSLYPAEIKATGQDPGVQLWELREEFAFYSDSLGQRITVPAGFITNLASIPKAVQNIIANDDPRIEMPSVIHDYCYTVQTVSREQADKVIREGMELQGAGAFIRQSVYLALRAFGGAAWDKNTPKPSP